MCRSRCSARGAAGSLDYVAGGRILETWRHPSGQARSDPVGEAGREHGIRKPLDAAEKQPEDDASRGSGLLPAGPS